MKKGAERIFPGEGGGWGKGKGGPNNLFCRGGILNQNRGRGRGAPRKKGGGLCPKIAYCKGDAEDNWNG